MTVIVVAVGTVVTINFLLSKSVDEKLELVIALKLSNSIMSPADMPWSPLKVIVTAVSPLSVLNAFVSVVVDLIGCMS